jgi:hypothetical protein
MRTLQVSFPFMVRKALPDGWEEMIKYRSANLEEEFVYLGLERE